MSTTAETKPLIRSTLRGELDGIGFQERKEGVYTSALSVEALGWLGLNRATRRGDGVTAINPVVGIRHQPVEKLVAELKGRELHPYIPATVSIPLGYLTPHRYYREWLITSADAVEGVVQELVAAIARYGVPFIEANSTLAALVTTLEKPNHGIGQNTAYRLPVAYALLGDAKRARESMAEYLQRFAIGDSPAAQQLQSFATALEAHLSQKKDPRAEPIIGSRSVRKPL